MELSGIIWNYFLNLWIFMECSIYKCPFFISVPIGQLMGIAPRPGD